jgi:hypothetical protein
MQDHRIQRGSPRTASNDRQSRIGGRDSRNGQFVPLRETERRPATTQREHIPLPGRGDTGPSDKPKK